MSMPAQPTPPHRPGVRRPTSTAGGFVAPTPAQQTPPPEKSSRRARRAKKVSAADPAAPRPQRKVMSRSLILAALFGLGGVLVVLVGLGSSGGPSTYVAVTSAAVPAMSSITESQIDVVVTDTAPASAVTGSDPDEVRRDALELTATKRTLVAVPAGTPIGEFLFTGDGQNAASTPLSADERLVSVRASVASAVGASVGAGDRVDIYGATSGGDSAVAGLVLADVEVVAVGPPEESIDSAARAQSTSDGRDRTASELLPASPIPGTYVIRVPADAVTDVLAVDSGGRLFMALRAENADGTVSNTRSMLQVLCSSTDAAAAPGACAGLAE